MPSLSATGAVSKARVPIAPVAGFLQLIDWGYNVAYSQPSPQAVGSYLTDQITPRSGAQFSPAVVAGAAQLDPYAQGIAARRPVYELNGGMNGFPCGRGDGGVIFITSTTANMYSAALTGTNTPYIFYITPQWLEQTDDAVFSFGSSAVTTSFLEMYAAVTANKVTIAQDGTVLITKTTATNDALRACWRVAFNGTNLQVEKDGAEVLAATAFNTAGVMGGNQDAFFALVRTTAAVFGHVRFQRRLWYAKSSETAAEKLKNYQFMHQGYLRAPANASFLLTEGDSTSQLENPWWQQLAPQGLGGVWVANPSIGSETLASMVTLELDHVTSNYPQGYARSASTLWAGSNDLLAGTSAAAIETLMTTWTTAEAAANAARGRIGGTVPAASTITGANETQRLALNTFIRANATGSLGFNDYVDRDGILGGTAFPASVLSLDGVHCNNLGNLALVNGANGYPGIKAVLQARGF